MLWGNTIDMNQEQASQNLLFRKNPASSRLGQKMVTEAQAFIVQYGLESLTFKKLAEQMGSTEASIYRYFTNKHQLFCYLVYSRLHAVIELVKQNAEHKSEAEIKVFLFTFLKNPGQFCAYLEILPVFITWYKSEQSEEIQYYIQACLQLLSQLLDLAEKYFKNLFSPCYQHRTFTSLIIFQILGAGYLFNELSQLTFADYIIFWERLMLADVSSVYAASEAMLELPLPLDELGIEKTESVLLAKTQDASPDRQVPQPPAAEVMTVVAAENISDPPQPAVFSFQHFGEISAVMIKKVGGYNMLPLKEFFAYASFERRQLILEGKVDFISDEGHPIQLHDALQTLQEYGLAI
jgi:AcrR family transcriptional regulator